MQQKLFTNAVRSQSCIRCDWFSCPTYCKSIRSGQSPIIGGPTSQLAGLKVSVVIALVSDTTGHLDRLEPRVIHIEAFMDWTCFGWCHKCSIRLGSGGFGGQVAVFEQWQGVTLSCWRDHCHRESCCH